MKEIDLKSTQKEKKEQMEKLRVRKARLTPLFVFNFVAPNVNDICMSYWENSDVLLLCVFLSQYSNLV